MSEQVSTDRCRSIQLHIVMNYYPKAKVCIATSDCVDFTSRILKITEILKVSCFFVLVLSLYFFVLIFRAHNC